MLASTPYLHASGASYQVDGSSSQSDYLTPADVTVSGNGTAIFEWAGTPLGKGNFQICMFLGRPPARPPAHRFIAADSNYFTSPRAFQSLVSWPRESHRMQLVITPRCTEL